MRFKIDGTCAQASSAGAKVRRLVLIIPPGVCADSNLGVTSTAPLPIKNFLMNSRRFVIIFTYPIEAKDSASSIYLAPLLMPRRVVLAEQFGRLVNVPTIAVAALVLDLRDIVLNHTIAPAEDGAVRPDLVEARPEQRGRRVADDHAVKAVQLRGVLFFDPADAVDSSFLEPRDRRFDGV